MANFLDELAPGSRHTWRDLCEREKPTVGTDALLMGQWREAIIAAVACEKAGRGGRYADGPAGQVLDYMMERGLSKFMKAAEKTEEAAHSGRIRPAGGGGGGGGGKPASHGSDSSSTLQIRCGRCGNTLTVAVPPGTSAGATIQAQCPSCGATNQAQMPFSAGMDPKPSKAPHMGGSAPRPSGRRKALLIGVNYFGTRAELRGCINDVHNLYRLLTETYGWPSHSVRTLTDDGRGNGGMPTRQNITQHMQWLSDGAQAGDVLFFSFSGHGAQQEDPHGYEEDGMNETILPVDFERAGMMRLG